MLRRIADTLTESARSLQNEAARLIGEGRSFIRGALEQIPLFAGTRAHELTASCERDETHYFLVPFSPAPAGFALSVERALPSSAGPVNSLPKVRIFHLHDAAARGTLEDLLRGTLAADAMNDLPAGSELADRLDRMAEAIDSQTEKVTGGLLVIGGLVAIANPLLGVGIAAKALLPSVASVAGKGAVDFVSDKLRSRAESARRSEAQEKASDEIKRLKPEVFINPLLRVLHTALHAPEPDHDPCLEETSIPADLAWMRVRAMTASAIAGCWEEALRSDKLGAAAGLHNPDVQWLRSLDRC